MSRLVVLFFLIVLGVYFYNNIGNLELTEKISRLLKPISGLSQNFYIDNNGNKQVLGITYSGGNIIVANGLDTTNIFGWQLPVSPVNYFIFKAVEIFDSGGSSAPIDLILNKGDALYIKTGGQGNNCLPSSYNNWCGKIAATGIKTASGSAKNYLLCLARCTAGEDQCRSEVNNFNCWQNYASNPDFILQGWQGWELEPLSISNGVQLIPPLR